MTIDRIILREVSLPFVHFFETSFSRVYNKQALLVQVEGEGITGWGECAAAEGPFYSPEDLYSARHVISRHIVPALFKGGIEKADRFPASVRFIRGQVSRAGNTVKPWPSSSAIVAKKTRLNNPRANSPVTLYSIDMSHLRKKFIRFLPALFALYHTGARLFFCSLGTCAGFYVLSFCRERDIPTDDIRVIQNFERDSETRKVTQINIDIQLPAEFPQKYVKAVKASAGKCTVKKVILDPPAFNITAKRG